MYIHSGGRKSSIGSYIFTNLSSHTYLYINVYIYVYKYMYTATAEAERVQQDHTMQLVQERAVLAAQVVETKRLQGLLDEHARATAEEVREGQRINVTYA
jgi:hypothetical protein